MEICAQSKGIFRGVNEMFCSKTSTRRNGGISSNAQCIDLGPLIKHAIDISDIRILSKKSYEIDLR